MNTWSCFYRLDDKANSLLTSSDFFKADQTQTIYTTAHCDKLSHLIAIYVHHMILSCQVNVFSPWFKFTRSMCVCSRKITADVQSYMYTYNLTESRLVPYPFAVLHTREFSPTFHMDMAKYIFSSLSCLTCKNTQDRFPSRGKEMFLKCRAITLAFVTRRSMLTHT